MNIVQRSSAFETNSSSTHALAITDQPADFYEKLPLKDGKLYINQRLDYGYYEPGDEVYDVESRVVLALVQSMDTTREVILKLIAKHHGIEVSDIILNFDPDTVELSDPLYDFSIPDSAGPLWAFHFMFAQGNAIYISRDG